MLVFRAATDDEPMVVEADDDGIDYLIQGLEQLRACDTGEEICAPSLDEDRETRAPTGVGEVVLRRA